MGIEMCIEAEPMLTQHEAILTAKDLGGEVIDSSQGKFHVFFPDTAMNLYYWNVENGELLTDDAHSLGLSFAVGAKMTFRYHLPKFDECQAQLRRYIETIAGRSQANFVLSFQMDRTYAIRDKSGLRYLERI